MSRNKHDVLRSLKNEVAKKRRQPIYSDEEARKLQEAERRIAEAAEIAEESNSDGDALRLFESGMKAEIHGKDIGLTLTEFELLESLREHSPKALTRQQLLEMIWGDHLMVTERTVDAHVRNVREKLGRFGDRIVSVRGVGYRYEE